MSVMAENWRDVPGHEGRYMVSDQGRMRSLLRAGLMQLTIRADGYVQVTLTKARGGQKAHYVHTLVLRAFVGPPPQGQETRHLSGIRSDNRLVNLCYGTPKENQADRERHGTAPRGEKNANAKLSTADVSHIPTTYSRGSGARMARELGISRPTLIHCAKQDLGKLECRPMALRILNSA